MTTVADYRRAAGVMYGEDIATFIYDVLEWAAEVGFKGAVTAARPVILAPAEMGPYNRRSGWYGPRLNGQVGPILVNRHHVSLDKASPDWFALRDRWDLQDTLVHELTHAYQHEVLIKRDGRDKTYDPTRGPHRCKSWYEAVSVACPGLFGIEVAREFWPLKKSVRVGSKVTKVIPDNTIPETVMTHWPESFREGIRDGFLDLPRV
jgi:hypothetical protein